jgi:hypothetical protein
MKKLQAHELFGYNLFTNIKQNYTVGVSCHLQSSEGELSKGKNMNTWCSLIILFVMER